MLKNILGVALGALVTILILGFVSGLIPTWLKNRFVREIVDTPTESPLPTKTPTATPKASVEPEPTNYQRTTKGGLVLGDSQQVTTNTASYATVVYEYQEAQDKPWLVRSNYDTRYEPVIDFDEVSKSYNRKVTICIYQNGVQTKCQSGSTDPGVHTLDTIVNGKKLVYEIIADRQGPTMIFEGPWRNSAGQTCVRVIGIKDNISPIGKLAQQEQMDNGGWRELHSEYCVSGGDKHNYAVKVTDERGNETVNTLNFATL